MSQPLTPFLYRTLERLARTSPAERLSFIVEVASPMTATSLAAAGMTIDQQVPEPLLVMGTMTPATALATAVLAGVLRIELDAQGVSALDGE